MEKENSNKEREKYKRPAFEGYVKAKDEWYWIRTQRLVNEENKKTAALAKISAAISITTVIAIFLSSVLHRRFE